MDPPSSTRIILVRHGPTLAGECLCGRTDIGADLERFPSSLLIPPGWGVIDHLVSSPARRCRDTYEAVFPVADQRPPVTFESRLWEQDFGKWEGLPFDQLPDLGHLDGEALAESAPPGGESFTDLCRRTHGAIRELVESHVGQTLLLAIHAGTIRAALALALGIAPGRALRFRIRHLSATRIVSLGSGNWRVDGVNQLLR